jgi:hypothetical protein
MNKTAIILAFILYDGFIETGTSLNTTEAGSSKREADRQD